MRLIKIFFYLFTQILLIHSKQDDIIVYPVLIDQNDYQKKFNILDYNELLNQNGKLNIEIELNKNKHIIILFLNDKLFDQNTLIEHKLNGSTKTYLIQNKSCYFNGYIKNVLKSYVSVSICAGMNGFLFFNNSVYLIEPKIETINRNNLTFEHLIHLTNESFQLNFFDHSLNSFEKRIKKRSISVEKTIETLVVADSTMSYRYKNFNLEYYLLTVMNMVSSIFRDPSLESYINIVVNKIIIFEEKEPFDVVVNATKTLESFCQYQSKINLTDFNSSEHDLAVLLTRVDICANSNTPCDTTGFANLGSVCNREKSCNVNEDTGLSVAFTIAHEIGHNLNAQHDTIENGCTNSTSPFLMNTHLSGLKKNHYWSECSKKQINKFLDRLDLKCLKSKKESNFKQESTLPGIYYDFDHQCKFAYGENATVCKNHEMDCSEIWCQIDNNPTCLSKGERAADGTLCVKSNDSWCIEGNCVLIDNLKSPVDGGWGNWSDWSNCTHECNGGVQYIERKCNNPIPSHGGRYCLGEKKRYRICNKQSCDDPLANWKDKSKQCSKFNNVPYGPENSTYEWEFSNFDPYNSCRLYCKPKTENFNVYFNEYFEDGTSCSSFSNDLCVNGRCQPVGCDWILGSKTTFDSCGLCDGDDTTCNMYKGTIQISSPIKGGYNPLFVIPKGARSILIEEFSKERNRNYLAVKNENGSYYLNGNFVISSSGDYTFNQINIRYILEDKRQYLKSSSLLKEDLLIMLLLIGNSASISYQYTLPNGYQPEEKYYYLWVYDSDWTACSKSCGKGIKKMVPTCKEIKNGKVPDYYCNPDERPDDLIENCNFSECEPYWWVGEWQECSGTCLTSGFGYKKRTVLCVSELTNFIDDDIEFITHLDSECDIEKKPHFIEECNIDLNLCSTDTDSSDQGYWIVEDWNRNCMIDLCSKETRVVKCSDVNSICDPNKRPDSERKCQLPKDFKCGKWKTSPWSNCNTTCGNGIRSRLIECIDGDICSNLTKPHDFEICVNNQPCLSNEQENVVIADVIVMFNKSNQFLDEIIDRTKSYNKTKKIISRDLKFFKKNFFDDENSIFSNKSLDYYDEEKNNSNNISFDWQTGVYGPCSRPCGLGYKSRRVQCISLKTNERVDEKKCTKVKPKTIEKCKLQECKDWNVTEWSECKSICGPGYQIRDAFCSDPLKLCDNETIPVKRQYCISKPCYEWRSEDWSECSVTCGSGFKIRRVYCFNYITNSTSDYCDKNVQPKTLKNCTTIQPCSNDNKSDDCLDLFSKSLCKMVAYSNRCEESYLKSKCCNTCQKHQQ